MKFLEHIRTASSPEKSRYALAIATSVTLVIATVWSTTLPARFTEIGKASDTISNNTATAGNSISDIIQNAQDQITNPTDTSTDTTAVNDGTDGTTYEPAGSALDNLKKPYESAAVATSTPSEKSIQAPTNDTYVAPSTHEAPVPKETAATSTQKATVLVPATPEAQVVLIATSTSQNSQ